MEWIVANANQIGVPALLMAALYALFRGWWVPGATYQACIDRTKALEQEAREAIVAKNTELDELKREFRQRVRGENS